MDAKDLRTEAALGARSNDGNTKYAQGGGALPSHRNKSYQDIGSNSLAKVDATAARPCAVIGPDRVVPPSATADAHIKKSPLEPWLTPENTYRRPPEYPHKLLDYQHPSRNISPRQTFQENMQRIMLPPSYNVVKLKEDHNFPGEANIAQMRNNKLNVPTDSNSKYCDVPYNVNSVTNDPKSVRNADVSASNINAVLARGAPHGWPPTSSNIQQPKPYHQELCQYPQYQNCVPPRSVGMTRPHRTVHEEPGPVYPDAYYHNGNIRFKPYPPVKDRYPQSRYEYIGSYTNPFHPPFPTHKYDLQKALPTHPYPNYPQVPLPYLDSRMTDPIMNGYQRTLNQQATYNNIPFRNQVIHPAYGPVPGNCLPTNKYYPYPPDVVKTMPSNKLPFDGNNKLYPDYDANKNKTYPTSEGFYINDIARGHLSKGTILPPNYPTNIHGIASQPYYRKEPLKGYEYSPHFRSMDHLGVNGNLMPRFPTQFSPSAIAISPSDSNTSNETNHTQGTSQDDCGYVSQSSTASVRSMDSGMQIIPPDAYRRYDHRYGQIIRGSNALAKTEKTISSNVSSKDKKDIDVRQFLQMWNEAEDEGSENKQEVVIRTHPNNVNNMNVTNYGAANQEQLYVLGLVNVPSEELGKYEHIQKVSKLPENIKGYNSIELLHQFEEVIESSNLSHYHSKSPATKEFRNSLTPTVPMHGLSIPSRPISPLDVEAKISQSVIHKDVGCNFEIKPCSPKMLNVEVAAPVQTVMGERMIEKVSNPLIIQQSIHSANETNSNSNVMKPRDHQPAQDNTKIASCKMINRSYGNKDSIDPIKTDYSIQDLESNSGVCLASLPRLDNDIELSFPEVNQQFINANKAESVITLAPVKELPTLHSINQSDTRNSELETNAMNPSPNNSNEKDFSKLSKYRKLKRKESAGPGTPESNVQALRTDSVIIKNPENCKSQTNMDKSPKPKSDAQDNPINLTINIENRFDMGTLNFGANELSDDKPNDFAIDFSMNTNESCNKISNLRNPDSHSGEKDPNSTIVGDPHKKEYSPKHHDDNGIEENTSMESAETEYNLIANISHNKDSFDETKIINSTKIVSLAGHESKCDLYESLPDSNSYNLLSLPEKEDSLNEKMRELFGEEISSVDAEPHLNHFDQIHDTQAILDDSAVDTNNMKHNVFSDESSHSNHAEESVMCAIGDDTFCEGLGIAKGEKSVGFDGLLKKSTSGNELKKYKIGLNHVKEPTNKDASHLQLKSIPKRNMCRVSKELLSPWIQKLILHNEGFYALGIELELNKVENENKLINLACDSTRVEVDRTSKEHKNYEHLATDIQIEILEKNELASIYYPYTGKLESANTYESNCDTKISMTVNDTKIQSIDTCINEMEVDNNRKNDDEMEININMSMVNNDVLEKNEEYKSDKNLKKDIYANSTIVSKDYGSCVILNDNMYNNNFGKAYDYGSDNKQETDLCNQVNKLLETKKLESDIYPKVLPVTNDEECYFKQYSDSHTKILSVNNEDQRCKKFKSDSCSVVYPRINVDEGCNKLCNDDSTIIVSIDSTNALRDKLDSDSFTKIMPVDTNDISSRKLKYKFYNTTKYLSINHGYKSCEKSLIGINKNVMNLSNDYNHKGQLKKDKKQKFYRKIIEEFQYEGLEKLSDYDKLKNDIDTEDSTWVNDGYSLVKSDISNVQYQPTVINEGSENLPGNSTSCKMSSEKCNISKSESLENISSDVLLSHKNEKQIDSFAYGSKKDAEESVSESESIVLNSLKKTDYESLNQTSLHKEMSNPLESDKDRTVQEDEKLSDSDISKAKESFTGDLEECTDSLDSILSNNSAENKTERLLTSDSDRNSKHVGISCPEQKSNNILNLNNLPPSVLESKHNFNQVTKTELYFFNITESQFENSTLFNTKIKQICENYVDKINTEDAPTSMCITDQMEFLEELNSGSDISDTTSTSGSVSCISKTTESSVVLDNDNKNSVSNSTGHLENQDLIYEEHTETRDDVDKKYSSEEEKRNHENQSCTKTSRGKVSTLPDLRAGENFFLINNDDKNSEETDIDSLIRVSISNEPNTSSELEMDKIIKSTDANACIKRSQDKVTTLSDLRAVETHLYSYNDDQKSEDTDIDSLISVSNTLSELGMDKIIKFTGANASTNTSQNKVTTPSALQAAETHFFMNKDDKSSEETDIDSLTSVSVLSDPNASNELGLDKIMKRTNANAFTQQQEIGVRADSDIVNYLSLEENDVSLAENIVYDDSGIILMTSKEEEKYQILKGEVSDVAESYRNSKDLYSTRYLKKRRRSLKRSLSDSALDNFRENSNENPEYRTLSWPSKRKKDVDHDDDTSHLIRENICHVLQNNRRNSISSIHDGNVSFCILIDNNCIITENCEDSDKICFSEIPDDCLTDIQEEPLNEEYTTVETVELQEELNCEYSTPINTNFTEEERSIGEPWLEDVACVETVLSDDIAENIVISASSSPKSEESNDGDNNNFDINEHTEKLKHIYGDKMYSDDTHFVETLYRTPQMNVNRTLNNRESQIRDDYHQYINNISNTDDCCRYYDKESLERVLSESNVQEKTTSHPEILQCITDLPSPVISEMSPDDVDMRAETPLFVDEEHINANHCHTANYDEHKEPSLSEHKAKIDNLNNSCESSIDDVLNYKKGVVSPKCISSSPEVSSTTSEEKNSGILLKITNYGGSRVSQVNDISPIRRISCKYTEKKDYLSSQGNLPTRTLITKGAQKYIPPLKETIRDLKVHLPLPPQTLMKLKELKIAKATVKSNVDRPTNTLRKAVPKKSKPKFEDVLKSIDEMHYQKHKENNKKGKKSIPRVVIKKNGNGSHYASTSSKDIFNPDLTGRKWQPWVFLEKDQFIDKMAVKKKMRAIFSYRKNCYVLAEKFQKYKSVCNAKFVISQPKQNDSLSGQLKYTIRLKHNYSGNL